MEMKWFLCLIFAFVTYTNAFTNSIPRWYNSHNQQHQLLQQQEPHYRNSLSSEIDENDDGMTDQQWLNHLQQQWLSYMRHSQQQSKNNNDNNNVFLRQIKSNQMRSCGKNLNARLATICGSCPPDGLQLIKKRSENNPKIVDACCSGQCTDDQLKDIACKECKI